MSDRINKMVDDISQGNGVEFKNEFKTAMNELIASKLHTRKAELANELVNSETEVVNEWGDVEEYIEADGTRRKVNGGDGRRVTEDEVEEGKDEEYEKFFKAALKKFGVSSPDELGDKKKEFFNYVDKNCKGEKKY